MLSPRTNARLITLACILLATTSGALAAGPYTVVDSSFSAGVYDFVYTTATNTADNGGVAVVGDPWLVNSGWVRDFRGVWFWKLPPVGVYFTPRYEGAGVSGTVGFDFSAVSGALEKVEVDPAHILFTYFGGITPPGTAGDMIVGEVSTPVSFGAGPYIEVYSHTGPFGGSPSAVSQSNVLLDITPYLSPAWLANPGLLELRFSYVQQTPVASPGCVSGCNELAGSLLENVQLFRDANLTDGLELKVRMLSDADGDGVPDAEDLCPSSQVPEAVPLVELKPNRWALVDADGIFDTSRRGGGNGPDHGFTTAETGGCACAQIIDLLELGGGHTNFGCSTSAMDLWVQQASP